MNSLKIFTEKLDNMPWQEKPQNYDRVIWRDKNNPIIKRNHTKSIDRIYNSSVIPYKGGYVGIFRADHKNNLPFIHVAFSKDGLCWEVDDNDIKWIDEEGNPYQPCYAYDPRLLELEGEYYIIFCTDFGGSPSIGMGKTTDFKTFIRLENPTVPCNRNGVLFPRKVNNKYLMLHRPSDNGHTPFGDIYVSESPDLVHWGRHRKVMSRGACGWWQGLKIGAGPVPIETSEGWVLFYHGVVNTCNGYIYSMGVAILDLEEPAKVKYRLGDFLICPEEWYETNGAVPNVVFPCSTLCDSETGNTAIYYGAADTYVAIAYTNMHDLIEYVKENSQLAPGDELPIK